MSRKAVLEGGKKDEIISAALKLFLENGYDGTSVRMILEQVDGEVGMFYHYFNSKQEVFSKAFELFMKKQSEQFSLLMSQNSDGMTPRKRLERLKVGYTDAMSDFAKLTNGTVHWTVLSTLHEITLEAMLPAFKTMLIEILQFAEKDDLSEVEWLAPFTLKGISGLLHEKNFATLSEEMQMYIVTDFICRTLQISKSVFEK